ncbi:hypothetical protein RFI_16278 [Reticulomyxa filosa]|uniref:Uncharacterized protein n=1 Tax=Reticulomyxa filosa TaxID=46433 RepID=X6N3S9_RETFI|nr:hypothetical protein RFI_16278 [Reticulomyxa filosa]|eukprot:ETO20925.1 hypothetical protein RFI_16278 [Reticulomyxa filosa]
MAFFSKGFRRLYHFSSNVSWNDRLRWFTYFNIHQQRKIPTIFISSAMLTNIVLRAMQYKIVRAEDITTLVEDILTKSHLESQQKVEGYSEIAKFCDVFFLLPVLCILNSYNLKSKTDLRITLLLILSIVAMTPLLNGTISPNSKIYEFDENMNLSSIRQSKTRATNDHKISVKSQSAKRIVVCDGRLSGLIGRNLVGAIDFSVKRQTSDQTRNDANDPRPYTWTCSFGKYKIGPLNCSTQIKLLPTKSRMNKVFAMSKGNHMLCLCGNNFLFHQNNNFQINIYSFKLLLYCKYQSIRFPIVGLLTSCCTCYKKKSGLKTQEIYWSGNKSFSCSSNKKNTLKKKKTLPLKQNTDI